MEWLIYFVDNVCKVVFEFCYGFKFIIVVFFVEFIILNRFIIVLLYDIVGYIVILNLDLYYYKLFFYLIIKK